MIRSVSRIIAMTILTALVTGGAFLAGYGASWFRSLEARHPIGDTPIEHQEQFRVFWEAWHLIEEHFYSQEPLDAQKMTYGAITGMVESLGDPHTTWIDPGTAAIMDEDLSGSFQGIGATVSMVDGYLTIVTPLSGSPAEKAGLRPGDIILAANGQPIEQNMSITKAISLIRGPEGTDVRLLIRRQKQGDPQSTVEEFEITVTRAKVNLPTVEAKLLPGNIAYLKLVEFNARADTEVRQALIGLLSQKPKGLILDLRDNPGGFLYAAIDVASQFIAEGVIVRERSKEGQTREYTAKRGGLATDIPLVVLVNRFSASAAEIVAGAIQDHKRGALIGEATFGKASIQNPYKLSDQSSLHLTVARWYTPNEQQIDGRGLTPDLPVEITEDDIRAGRDPQLERAKEYLIIGQ